MTKRIEYWPLNRVRQQDRKNVTEQLYHGVTQNKELLSARHLYGVIDRYGRSRG
jgi:hypothetical protein